MPLPAALPGAVAPPGTGSLSWQTVVNAFLDAESDSPHTRRAYARHLQVALAAAGVTTLDQLTALHLAEHRARVIAGGLAPASQAQALAALRAFLRWTGVHGAHRLSRDVLDVALRMPRATVRRPYIVLGESEVEAMLGAATGPRDRALLAVLLGAGLRAAEAVGLDVPDLHDDPEGGMVIAVRRGTGRRDRQVPVQTEVSRLLLAYLTDTGRRLGDPGPLFRAHDRGSQVRERARLSTRAVGYLVRRALGEGRPRCEGDQPARIAPHVRHQGSSGWWKRDRRPEATRARERRHDATVPRPPGTRRAPCRRAPVAGAQQLTPDSSRTGARRVPSRTTREPPVKVAGSLSRCASSRDRMAVAPDHLAVHQLDVADIRHGIAQLTILVLDRLHGGPRDPGL
jgi:site-specific recombinase XerD